MAEASAVLARQGLQHKGFELGNFVVHSATEKMQLAQRALMAHAPSSRARHLFRDVLERIPDAERAACINSQERVLAEMRKYAEGLESGVIS